MSGMDKLTALVPCPFCGGEADTMTPEADDMRAATVMCMGCYCTGKECETEAQAIAAWNRRASQAAPAPSDGTCAECGCAPVNADSLCATCVDERRAPAPSDALREAMATLLVQANGVEPRDDRLRQNVVRIARAALSTPTEERQ